MDLRQLKLVNDAQEVKLVIYINSNEPLQYHGTYVYVST